MQQPPIDTFDAFGEDYLARLPAKVAEINRLYQQDREALAEEHGTDLDRPPLFLKYRPAESLSWQRPLPRQSKPTSSEASRPLSRTVHCCDPNGDYSRRNLAAMLSGREHWERDLTVKYEVDYARPIRDWLKLRRETAQRLKAFSETEFPE